MAYRNLAECVADLEKHGRLRRIDFPVDPILEAGAIQRRVFRAGGPAILFTRPKNCAFPLLANLYGTRERLEFIFRDSIKRIRSIFQMAADAGAAMKRPWRALRLLPAALHARPRPGKGSPPLLANTCPLSHLPRLVSWPGDGGPFITLPIVQSQDPLKKSTNLGMYRVQLAGGDYAPDEAGMHYQIHRGIGVHHARAIGLGRDLPVNIYVGGPPALTLAAIMPLPEGISELAFAGLLGGRRQEIWKVPDNPLPVLGNCDFLISGFISLDLKAEGPFGDHMGYYSLRHDFPVLKAARASHRDNAIWPFTTVGRPPQEDTIFGEFVHELTGPLVGQVFSGLKEVRAVDAAGVHPLLLAIGSERYTPYERERKARELLTQALHLLGTTQTALAKYLLIAAREDAPEIRAADVAAFFRHMLERTDFERDLHFITGATCDSLDYSGRALHEGSKLIWASAGPKRRNLAREIHDLPDLPEGFAGPRMAAPGILVISGPGHALARGETDTALENGLARILEAWPQREEFPLLVIADDPDFCAASFENFLWVAFTRSDPATDCYGPFAKIRAKGWSCQAPLIIDARLKTFHAPPLEEDPEVAARIEALAAKGGPLEGLF